METGKIRILICDDMPFIAESTKSILETNDDLEVIAITSSGKECIEAAQRLSPDIILLDIQMSLHDEGIITLEKLKQINPDIKIIMCTIHSEDEFIMRSFVLGASGYLVKTDPTETIVATIRDVYNNNVSLNANIARTILSNCIAIKSEQSGISKLLDTVATLTISEYEILKLIYAGKSYMAIADERYVEESTIRSQVNKILKKFEYKNMKQLIKYLKTLNIFE